MAPDTAGTGTLAREPSYITANLVAAEVDYALQPFTWGQADRATQDAFHGPTFAQKFDALCGHVAGLGFRAIDLWVAHLNPLRASDGMVDEAIAILRRHGLTVVAYTAGLGRPELTRQEAERIYTVARRLGAPLLGVGLHPSHAQLAFDLGRAYGIRYAIENHPEKTPQELLARIGPYGEVIGVTQDTGFWGMFGYDAVRATYELKDHLLHMHLKQMKQAPDGHWACSTYDDGVVDIQGVVGALKAIDYQGVISIEIETTDQDPTPLVARSKALLTSWLA
jgi:sugar phosphate isomerase/epimerase